MFGTQNHPALNTLCFFFFFLLAKLIKGAICPITAYLWGTFAGYREGESISRSPMIIYGFSEGALAGKMTRQVYHIWSSSKPAKV